MDTDESDYTDLVLDGYDTPTVGIYNPYVITETGDYVYVPYFAVPQGLNSDPITVITSIPGQDITVVSPQVYIPTTEIVQLINQAWNTSARSIAALVRGYYLLFTAADITGACLMLGPKEKDGQGIHTFSHGLTVDPAGVHVYEGGVFKTTLRSPHNSVTALRIYRHENGNIVYVTTTETETIVYNSLAAYPLPSFIDVFVYGYLYSSGDQITDASFETGEVQYGSV